MPAPLSPPQLRMVCFSSTATNMQQVLPYLGQREKVGFFSFCPSPHFASDDLEIICTTLFSTTKLFKQIKTLKSTDNAA